MAEHGNVDLDYNLVFRWDWLEGDDDPGASEYNGDDNYRNGIFRVFIMGQRKGLYFSTSTQVCRADEPAVRSYLEPRLAHLLSLWAPLHDSRAAA